MDLVSLSLMVICLIRRSPYYINLCTMKASSREVRLYIQSFVNSHDIKTHIYIKNAEIKIVSLHRMKFFPITLEIHLI